MGIYALIQISYNSSFRVLHFPGGATKIAWKGDDAYGRLNILYK